CLPKISTVKRQDDTYSINNGEEYHSGMWKKDKPYGCGSMFKNYGSTIYHGEFHNQNIERRLWKTTDLKVTLRGAVYKRSIYDTEVLLELGANVNVEDPSSGQTVLHWAVMEE
ncbi:unnamed protein product, partial [Rotaria sp. Silwood2]